MNYIDISHVLGENTPSYPGDEPLRLSKIRSLDKDRYTAYHLQTGLHTGTHIDMPMHLVEDTRMASEFDIGCFAGRGVLLDVRGETVIPMRPEFDTRVQSGDIVLLHTGWYKHYGAGKYFSEHPLVGDELGRFLLSRGIKMLGMDMPSPDFAPHIFHRELLRDGVFLLENLTNLSALTGIESFDTLALPLKIEAEASPVRAVCRIK